MDRKRLQVDMLMLEVAFEDDSFDTAHYFDLETGEVLTVTDEIRWQLDQIYEETEDDDITGHIQQVDLPGWMKEAVLEAHRIEMGTDVDLVAVPPADSFYDYGDMADFIASISDDDLPEELYEAIRGRGAFRRFGDLVHSRRDLKHKWQTHRREAIRARVVEWLHSIGIEPIFETLSIPEPEPVRPHLLAETSAFIEAATKLSGVSRIALIGSLATETEWPNDVDLLVTIEDEADLTRLARLSRQLRGHVQAHGLGADVFLADPRNRYLGRTCPWKDCRPGIRVACDALSCGEREYLHDDLGVIKLSDELVATPPIELWPQVVVRTSPPRDVWELLLEPLDG